MQVKSISTHTNGKNQCFLLSEGAAFNIISDKYHTGKFTEKDGAEILKAVYGIKTAILREKMKTNMDNVKSGNVFVQIVSENSSLDGDYQLIVIEITPNVLDTWNATIYAKEGLINLPVGCVDDICRHLLSNGVAKPRSFGKYDTIKFVSFLPAEENAVRNTAYVLKETDNGKPAGSAWVHTGVRYEELSDEPAPEPNPEDTSTIPDSLVKEEAPANVGSPTEPEAQLWDVAMTNTTTATATETISVVNSTIKTGILKATVA